MCVEYYGISDIGKLRSLNEDFFAANEEYSYFLVADGMGGHNAGEVASSEAAKEVERYISEHWNTQEGKVKLFCDAIKNANAAIYKMAITDQAMEGMGTTLDVCYFSGNNVDIFHIGDSRVYLISNGAIRQLTTDHSLVEELVQNGSITREQAKTHPQRNVITRALGTEPGISIDVIKETLASDDLILMCSDGLNIMMDDEEIRNIITRADSLENAAYELVKQANENGGADNITVQLIRYKEAYQ